jgi:hypothetical protein
MENSTFFTEDELNNLEKIQFNDFELTNENLSLLLDNFVKNIKIEDFSYYTKVGKEIIDIILKFCSNPLHISIAYNMLIEKFKENIICKVIVLYFYGNIYKHSDAIYSYETLIEKYFIETNYCKKRNISNNEYKKYLYNELPKLLSFYNYSVYMKDLFENHTIASSFDALCIVNDNKKFINGSGRTLSTELRMIIIRDVLNIILKNRSSSYIKNRKKRFMKNNNFKYQKVNIHKKNKIKKSNINFLTSYEMYKDLLSEDLLSTDYIATYKNLEIIYEICN